MLAAVVPIKNEEKRLKRTIETLLSIPAELIITVINGSNDNSYNVVGHILTGKILPLHFTETLGFDIPRAIGAKAALERGATTVLFIDGDMDGNISEKIMELADIVGRGADMALTDCYPGENIKDLSHLANHVLKVRYQLNQTLGLEQSLGTASPSHGPHAVSRRLLLSIPLRELAIPPVSLALAAKGGLKVHVGTRVPHKELQKYPSCPAYCRNNHRGLHGSHKRLPRPRTPPRLWAGGVRRLPFTEALGYFRQLSGWIVIKLQTKG